ncbi:MAG TPA: hypothetical protein VFS34_04875 [Thermoanaerobaculia bacterium]|nr:hypothetical protein [Thermoanaerobaculia bacterium]
MRTARAIGLLAAVLAPAAVRGATDAAADFPNVRVGGQLFADFTYQAAPSGTDAAGNAIHPNSFNVTRAYVNVFGNLSRVISARITSDIVRDTDPNSSLSGSAVYRLKYAYAQAALDDAIGRGSWIRIGLQSTPYISYVEEVYPYRFQGPLFFDREGLLVSADAGISARWAFPFDYGDVVVGVFNGEGYAHSEANDQKALQARIGIRPLPRHPVLRGLRFAVFGDRDHYQGSDPKDRLAGVVTFEHPWFNAGFEFGRFRDRSTPGASEANGRGWSAWATPRTPIGVGGLLRYDHTEPDEHTGATRTREIAGIAYWFPLQKGIATAVMVDYERDRYPGFSPPKPTEERWALHTLVSF